MSEFTAPALASGEQAGADSLDFLIVQAADELYGLAGASVREVLRWRAPTPVPGAPPVLPGIISQHGVVLPVVDLRLALGLSAVFPGRAARLVILQHEAGDLALFVDAVLDLVSLPAAARAQPPIALDPARARLLAAVARHDDRPLALLNLAALIAAVQEGL